MEEEVSRSASVQRLVKSQVKVLTVAWREAAGQQEKQGCCSAEPHSAWRWSSTLSSESKPQRLPSSGLLFMYTGGEGPPPASATSRSAARQFSNPPKSAESAFTEKEIHPAKCMTLP